MSHHYQKLVHRRLIILLLLALITLLAFMAELALGPANYSLGAISRALLGQSSDQALNMVLWDIRLPIALTAVLVGASLSIAGLQMQTVLNNPLASPFTLGLSSAASFGAALTIVLGISFLPEQWLVYAVSVNAFLCSMLAAAFIYYFSQRHQASTEMIVLLGTSLVFTFSALTDALQYISPEQAISAVVFWNMGSLARTNWVKLAIVALCFISCFCVFARQSWALTALKLGNNRAKSFGISVASLRLQGILLSSVLAACCVAFVGVIGFVGLIGPHIARLLVGDDQRFLLPASALSGALLLSCASVASKTLVTGQSIPIGIVTAFVGVPLFLILIVRAVKL
ncbi:FecCD family ABC transporter permease [Acinetobacter larvae]|uniref:Iron-siderophore ABC transporter permease n=1 Tax=Acinetobacter larvae TaxID=1789224 RepID=A0A1B2M2F6_9GAMM|nr:iron ABC transporter permease [Acinetobacter larvae]AOA59372.1 iron-siderophore ABC transporter permease [Acinetobacter larvae]